MKSTKRHPVTFIELEIETKLRQGDEVTSGRYPVKNTIIHPSRTDFILRHIRIHEHRSIRRGSLRK